MGGIEPAPVVAQVPDAMKAVLLAALVAVASVASARMCGSATSPPAVYDHVVWIWFENHSYDEIVGSPDAPYMNRLAARCGLATSYHALAHPSLPNYIAATSGMSVSALGPLREDCDGSGGCRIAAPNVFLQAPSWGAYAESLPSPCATGFVGTYAANHNPAVYYTNLSDCAEHDVGLPPLWRQLAAGRLPAFAFVAPNRCHSMHDCPVSTGDRWLRRVLSRLVRSAAYRRGRMAVFVTFDESADADPDNHVATFVIARATPAGGRGAAPFTHYSLLRTTEEMLGVGLLGEAARAPSMRAAFGL